MTRQLARFGVVGLLGYVVDSGVLYAAMALGLGSGLGRLLSFLSAVLATWLLNRRFTFKPSINSEGAHSLLREWLRYVAAMSVGGVLNLASYAWIMASSTYYPGLPALAVAVGSVVGMMANFAGAKFWVDGQRAQAIPELGQRLHGHWREFVSGRELGWWVGLALGLGCFKVAVLALTPNPQFFLGDSASYLHTALTDWRPNDRSYWYGVWIRTVVADTRSLVPLLIAQAGVSAGTAFLAAYWAHVVFRPHRWAVVLVAFVCAVDPSQLLMERYVMTETLTLLFMALMWTSLTLMIVRGRIGWMCLAVLAGTMVLALRFSLMPVVALMLLAAPLLGRWAKSLAWWKVYLALLTALLVMPPGLQLSGALHSGKFLLAAWSPLLQEQDFADPSLAQRVLSNIHLENTALFSRERNLWARSGLIHRIEGEVPDALARESLYKSTSMRILIRDPLGVCRLGWTTYKSLWNADERRRLVEWDIGMLPLDTGFRQVLLGSFRLAATEVPETDSMISRYYRSFAPWTALPGLVAFLLMALSALGLDRKQIAPLLLLALASLALLVVIAMFATLPVIRYLHPMGWMLTAACLPKLLTSWRRANKHLPAY